MRESNQFHAICLDTWPPIFYLTDVSKQIMQMVHAYNKEKGSTRLAYTYVTWSFNSSIGLMLVRMP